ncbi:hypothetical protein FACS1894103_4140 [Campylobacterota bacterium]|nr:hypothetical protein FACS1894103_4140 [Campylobacterota bacterium]
MLNNDDVLMEKTVDKINEMTAELKEKTNIGVYISAAEKLENNETITAYTKRLGATLESPFVLITLSSIDRQIDLITSDDLTKRIDKDEVLDDYIIPIFVEIRKDISRQNQLSAGIFNGVAFVVDTLADQEGIELESSVGSGSKNFYDGLMWLIRVMGLLTVGAFAYLWLRDKRAAK